MSQENVDLVRTIYAAWERGDKVTRVVQYFDRERALEAVGMRE